MNLKNHLHVGPVNIFPNCWHCGKARIAYQEKSASASCGFVLFLLCYQFRMNSCDPFAQYSAELHHWKLVNCTITKVPVG